MKPMDIQPNEVFHLYRYHPLDGRDAEDFTATEMGQSTTEQREQLAEMRRKGARFYWCNRLTGDGSYARVERSNIQFVIDVCGCTTEIHQGADEASL